MLPSTRRPSATTGRQRVEVRVEQHQLGDRPRRVAPRAHRDPDVGVLQRERVVHAVTGHRHRVPVRLQRVHHRALLLRRDAAEHRVRLEHARPARRLVVGELAGVDRLVGAVEPELPAIAPTVRGSSPEMTFTVTPCSGSSERVGRVRTRPVAQHHERRRARGRREAARRRRPAPGPGAAPGSPRSANSATRSRSSSCPVDRGQHRRRGRRRTTPRARRTPRRSTSASDENGTRRSASQPGRSGNRSAIAVIVALGEGRRRRAPRAPSRAGLARRRAARPTPPRACPR